MLAILDGAVMPADEARIPVTDEGLLRGDGVFEVVRLYERRPFALDDHLARMERSAQTIRLPIDIAAIRADIVTLLARNDVADAALRVLVTRGGRRIGIVEELAPETAALTLATVEYAPTRVLDEAKTLSYAANVLARRLAAERGADDALLVTPDGTVLEATTSSFFAVLPGEGIVTPPLAQHVLDSITRRRVIAVCDVAERALTRDDLATAQEAFLASTLREVQAVAAIDGAPLPSARGPLSRDAAQRVRDRIQTELDRRD